MEYQQLSAWFLEVDELFSDLRDKKDVSRERIDSFITKVESNPKLFKGVMRDASPEMRIAQDEPLDENTTIADIQERLSGLRPKTNKPFYIGPAKGMWWYRVICEEINQLVTCLLGGTSPLLATSPRLAKSVQGVIDAIRNMRSILDEQFQASAVVEVPRLSKDDNVDTKV